MEKYEIFSTTADVGVDISGSGYKELLNSAVKGLNLLLFGKQPPPTPQPGIYPFEFHGDSFENVLVNLLSEILFLLQTRMLVTFEIETKEVSETYLNANFHTAPVHKEPEMEIKSVTYHNLKIDRSNRNLSTQIVFDI